MPHDLRIATAHDVAMGLVEVARTEQPETAFSRVVLQRCRTIRDVLAPLLADPASPGEIAPWQPIESAPKDGTAVLVYSPSLGPVIVRYVDSAKEKPRGCCTKWLTLWDSDALAREPTHWMPLPPPPRVVVASTPQAQKADQP